MCNCCQPRAGHGDRAMSIQRPHLSPAAHLTGARPAGGDADPRDELQRALLEIYQTALKAAGGDPRAVSREGSRALADLLVDLEGVIRHAVHAFLAKRYPGKVNVDLHEECVAEARAACVAAAGRYDPSRGRFRTWVLATRGGPAMEAAKVAARAHLGHEWLTQGQEIAARYAHAVRSDLRAAGHEPSTATIRDEAVRRCLTWALDRVDEQWARTGRPPGDEVAIADERLRLARAKLRKDGTLGALEGDLCELLASTESAVSLDAIGVDLPTIATGPSGTATLADVAVCAMSASEREIVWSRSWGELQAAGSAGPEEARVLSRSRSLLGAPHAHFAVLAPTLGIQFESPRALGAGDLSALVRTAMS